MPMLPDELSTLMRRAEKAKDAIRVWFPLFEELAHYFYLNREGFQAEIAPGTEQGLDIWDSAPEGHRQKLAQSFVEAMCPRERYYIGLVPARIELMQVDLVRLWCQKAAYYMYLTVNDPRANFIEAMNELADDIYTFGTGVIYIDFNRKKGHLTFSVKYLRDFAFEVDIDAKMTRAYCFYTMSLDDLVEQFGIEQLPDELAQDYRRQSDCTAKTHCVVHAIVPSDDYARYGSAPGRFPYRSLWVLKRGDKLLAESGYYDMPYVLVRCYRRSSEAMGRCDAMRALPDARMIQAVAAALLEITEKQGNPPMQMPFDVIRGDLELWPGGANFFNTSGFQYQGDPIRPIEIGANPALAAEYLQALDKKIGKVFFADLLNIPDEGLTPEQHMAMEMMKAIVLAPLWSRTENETLPPILDRVFNIMHRYKALPPDIEELAGEQLVYKFDNKIADMREKAKAQDVYQAIAMPLQLQHPEIVEKAVENLDVDATLRGLWQMLKVPQNYIRSMQDVEADRQQREQFQQAQAMAEVAKSGGPGVKQAIEGAVQARDQGLLPAQ